MPTQRVSRRLRPDASIIPTRRLGQLAAAGLLDDQHITAALIDAAADHAGISGFTAAEPPP